MNLKDHDMEVILNDICWFLDPLNRSVVARCIPMHLRLGRWKRNLDAKDIFGGMTRLHDGSPRLTHLFWRVLTCEFSEMC